MSTLAVAWTFATGEDGPQFESDDTVFEATPIVAGGTLFVSTSLGRVFALDPATGAVRWSFDAKIDRDGGYGDFVNRGVATWLDARAPAGALVYPSNIGGAHWAVSPSIPCAASRSCR